MDELRTALSVLALIVSAVSIVLSVRADRRARQSVRPYMSTGVHIASSDDMSVSLSNYGAGVAIISKISMSRDGKTEKSMVPLVGSSNNYEIDGATVFVQDEYFVRPGDKLTMVIVKTTAHRQASDALQDWTDKLDGIKIQIDYSDIFGKRFSYARIISTKGTNST
jgi:hypothetical protein